MDGYRHCLTLNIRFADIDRLDHVNNAIYMTYIEQSRVQYVDDLTAMSGLPRLQMIVAKLTIEYKLPLVYADKTVDVWGRVSRLGNKSFTMEHLITRGSDNAVAATGEVVVVSFDYATNQPTPIPDAWRQFITDYEPAL